ncbi:iron-sulfur cluster biosynthesis family protein [Gorillibacterium sp. CAU 1737]|uniref:iron-sulfur cluster biosynthesis family protein n=1 Tax=Gorillibacterium sp. CAU 1737 TaxID=3140362 RepID=UPI0032610D21
MKIELNAYTEQKLREERGEAPGCFKLFYDTQDCGCNGVLVIQIVSEPLPTDIQASEAQLPFVVDRQQRPLFDETMRIEADPTYPSFKVTSDASLFSTNVRVQDLRG